MVVGAFDGTDSFFKHGHGFRAPLFGRCIVSLPGSVYHTTQGAGGGQEATATLVATFVLLSLALDGGGKTEDVGSIVQSSRTAVAVGFRGFLLGRDAHCNVSHVLSLGQNIGDSGSE